jgi:3-oxoacyl-[acyl-carrier-protein] synthase II
MSRRNVVVTGLGSVSSAGLGADQLWDQVTVPVDRPVDGRIADFDPSPWFKRSEVRRSDPVIMWAVAAADLAHRDAGEPALASDRTAIVLGTIYGAAGTVDAQRDVMDNDGAKAVSPVLAAVASEDAAAAAIALRFHVHGAAKAVVAGCASGAFALADAAMMIRSGICDVVFAGASMGPLTPHLRASYENLRVHSKSGWVRPFDRRREGFEFAEGAAVLLLEESDHAERRGATVYARLEGAACTNDATHLTNPSGDGTELCMRMALRDAGLAPADIGHVNAHGSATVTNDRMEAAAIRRVFGDDAPAVTSIKRATGHSLAAAGAFEAVVVAQCMVRRALPPSAIELQLDPEIDLDVVAGEPRAWVPSPVLSNSFGLGGHNGCLVFVPAEH